MAKHKGVDSSLLRAMEHISVAQRAIGTDGERFCLIIHGEARAFNGIIAAGCPIEENLSCCPNTYRLWEALKQCESGFTVAHKEAGALEVRSGDFVANIPLIDGIQLQWVVPDNRMLEVSNNLKAAILAVADLTDDKSERVYEASMLLADRTVRSTNGTLILESWHGFNLPDKPQILLPKVAAKALKAIKKNITHIGLGQTTLTFWFEDGSWMRTQRYQGEWPASSLMDLKTNPRKMDTSLFRALDKLKRFSEDKSLYCSNHQASSHPFFKANIHNAQIRAEVDCPHNSRVYDITTLEAIRHFATTIDDTTLSKRSYVYGTASVKLGTKKTDTIDVRMRGVFAHDEETNLTHGAIAQTDLPSTGNMETWYQEITDDDIPF